MRRIGNEAALLFHRQTDPRKQLIDCDRERPDLERQVTLFHRVQLLTGAQVDFLRECRDRAEHFAYQISDDQ